MPHQKVQSDILEPAEKVQLGILGPPKEPPGTHSGFKKKMNQKFKKSPSFWRRRQLHKSATASYARLSQKPLPERGGPRNGPKTISHIENLSRNEPFLDAPPNPQNEPHRDHQKGHSAKKSEFLASATVALSCKSAVCETVAKTLPKRGGATKRTKTALPH